MAEGPTRCHEWLGGGEEEGDPVGWSELFAFLDEFEHKKINSDTTSFGVDSYHQLYITTNTIYSHTVTHI